jgi:hypothetical protein
MDWGTMFLAKAEGATVLDVRAFFSHPKVPSNGVGLSCLSLPKSRNHIANRNGLPTLLRIPQIGRVLGPFSSDVASINKVG